MPETISRSPDGRYVVEAEPVPMRMSHVVFPPVVRDLEGGVVASLEGTLWSVDKAVWSDGRVTLTLRKYPGGRGAFTATVDLEGGTATVRGQAVPAAGLGRALDLAAAGHGDRDLAALLYDTLDALDGVPDTFALEVEIHSILHDLEAGAPHAREALALYQSERRLQDVVFEHGWADRVLEVAGTPDHSHDDAHPGLRRPASRAPGGSLRLVGWFVAVVALLVAAVVLGGR